MWMMLGDNHDDDVMEIGEVFFFFNDDACTQPCPNWPILVVIAQNFFRSWCPRYVRAHVCNQEAKPEQAILRRPRHDGIE